MSMAIMATIFSLTLCPTMSPATMAAHSLTTASNATASCWYAPQLVPCLETKTLYYVTHHILAAASS